MNPLPVGTSRESKQNPRSKLDRAGAAALIGAPLVSLIANSVLPTLSDDAAARVRALQDHHAAIILGLALAPVAIGLTVAGVFWLASTLAIRAPRLAVAGGAVSIAGGLVVLFVDGLLAAAPVIANSLVPGQGIHVLDRLYSSPAAHLEPLAVLIDIGLVLLAVAASAGGPRWLTALLIASALIQAIGEASGSRPVVIAGFVGLFLCLAGLVRTLDGDLRLVRPGLDAAPAPVLEARPDYPSR